MTVASATTPGGQASRPGSLGKRLWVFANEIKIQHTVFAMPWAILSAVLAGRMEAGSLTWGKISLIVVCMVTARTVAMSANRLFDAELDAKNPRTARRALPSGKLSRGFVGIVLAVCALGFAVACAGFWVWYRNPWPGALAGPVLIYLAAYPFMKRFTRLCHYYLGVALALAPVCAWVAVLGRMDWAPVVMFLIVACWTAGFDIIYACQDYASDVANGVFSIPAKAGIGKALWISRGTHAVAAVMLLVLGHIVGPFGVFYFTGAGIAIALLVVEQSLVRADDLSKVNLSFFTINGIISVVLAGLGIVDLMR